MLSSREVQDLFLQFKVKVIAKNKYPTVFKSERLTPDLEVHALLTNDDKFYVLYIEDYIASLEGVGQNIEHWFPSRVGRFVKPKVTKKFKDTTGSRFYVNPDAGAVESWMKYALDDVRSDYVFLAEVEPVGDNESYWVETRIGPQPVIPPEAQAVIDTHMPLDATRPFLETWLEQKSRES